MGNEIEKTGAKGLAQYGSFDLEEMQGAADKLPVGGGGNFYKPGQGKNVVRFIPPMQGKKPIKIWFKHYFQLGKDRRYIVCTKYQYNEHCPLCARAQKLRTSGNKADAAKAKSFDPQAQVYANIVDMKTPEKGVQLWTMSQGVFKKIMEAIDLAGVGKTFADPERGFNILFMRKGEGLNTEYTGHTVDRSPSPLPDAETLLASQIDVESCESPPTDEEQDDALEGEFEDKSARPKTDRAGGSRRERSVNEAPAKQSARGEISYDDEDDVPH